MQVEMAVAGESTTPPERSNGFDAQAINDRTENVSKTPGEGSSDGVPTEKDFKDLSSVEMMDVLTRHLLKWQQEYGKFGER
jgi:hypothetical protein